MFHSRLNTTCSQQREIRNGCQKLKNKLNSTKSVYIRKTFSLRHNRTFLPYIITICQFPKKILSNTWDSHSIGYSPGYSHPTKEITTKHMTEIPLSFIQQTILYILLMTQKLNICYYLMCIAIWLSCLSNSLTFALITLTSFQCTM